MDIEIKSISKAFGDKQVLKDFSATLKSGAFYVLTGVSGVGKTTLLHILLGLLAPDAGRITSPVRYSAVFQENRLLPKRSAVDNLLFVLPSNEARQSAQSLLTELLPAGSLYQPIEELSGGMQRRVAIARALAAQSDCVVMDEPFTGLDEGTQEQTAAFIVRHLQGRTLLLSTHQLAAVTPYKPEIITLTEVKE